ncbi:gamma-glutamyltransferase [Bacterioplanoides sp.]|uniref:gamma-glutamyltransferase n=1 Tax=Bacterioplanoides sp. TaxID=2066072 RepID=UPI003B5CABA3
MLKRTLLLLSSSLIIACSQSPTTSSPQQTDNQPKPTQAAIASAHPLSTQAGMDILNQGGNAFDAAIAVAASLGVVEPYSAGIGGGGFWLIYEAEKDKYTFIDAREMAPAAAHKDYYLDKDGKVNRDKAVNGPTAAAIPGQAAAFAHLAENYGELPLSTSLAASIEQAKEGFPVYEHYRKLMGFRLKNVRRYANSREILLEDGEIPEVGYIVKQPDLANTLQAVADNGFDGFYKGQVAKKLVEAIQTDGGDWTLQDLANYKVIEREPIRLQFGDYDVISAPPPSSGGIAIAQMLKMLAQGSLPDWKSLNSVDQTHLLTEVMRRAYKDRAEYLGDPDYFDVPFAELLSDTRAKNWAASIDMQQATPSLSLNGVKNLQEGFHTTHLSVIDQQGNMVSATLSINLPFGSAYTANGTGVLLNNEMDDFSAKPGEPNAYGLVGNEANAIAPGKRPLSSMSPSIVNTENSTAIIGTPGGSRIITMVFLGTLEHMQNKPVEDWVSRKRFHHQYLPDVIQHEPDTFTDREQVALLQRGHQLKNIGRQYGNMQAILWDKQSGKVTAASDPRGYGQSQVSETAQ